MGLVLALDEGTTSSRGIVFDAEAGKRGLAQIALPQIFPRPGWVEHDPVTIWEQQLEVAQEALRKSGASASEVASIGITNQRETVVVWERATGRPIHNAIVWQDRRTAAACNALTESGAAGMLRERTGLPIDPYFSATKIAWILENVDGARARAETGELACGTIDSWLIWNLTAGEVHATDVTNASRTQLFDIEAGAWGDELLELFGIPRALLPDVVPSSGVMGETATELFGAPIPIASACGDQQASLAGHGGFAAGDAKATFGTGIFALMHTGNERPHSESLAVTLAAQTGDELEYAVEGAIFMGGAIVQWLVEEMHIADSPAEAEALAASVDDANGVVFVPALTGLGAPRWDPYARGALFGLTRGATNAHVARAAMESIPMQIGDLMDVMERDAGYELAALRVDGGVTVNKLVMQSLADILGMRVNTAEVAESTAMGAAFLAGRVTGVWDGADDLPALRGIAKTYEPDSGAAERLDRLRVLWNRAMERDADWLRDDEQE